MNIAVIGDIILDKYWMGVSDRISPEAPVPVVKNIKEDYRLGGAGNVARNIKQLCPTVTLFGVVGKDKNADVVRSLLDEEKIQHNLPVANGRTITKLRVVSHQQQLCRIDTCDYKKSSKLFDTFERWANGNEPELVVLSDYSKGAIQDPQEYINSIDIPVLVDPKGNDWEKYSGAYVITPNEKEWNSVYGEFRIDDAIWILDKLNISNLLLTQGSKGMTWVCRNGTTKSFPSEAKEVFDVTGAGDTVISVLAANIYKPLPEAIQLANKAAGIVVGKFGSSVVTIDELHESTVFTNGCFDILHPGHIELLEQAKKLGTKLVVGLNSDDSVKRIKREPTNSQEDRKKVLEGIASVDEVIIFDEDTPYELIKEISPDILVKGGDYNPTEVVGADLVNEVVIIPTVEGKSTTNIIDKIKGA